MQQQMTPPRALPTCRKRHTARYMLDYRRLEARGGHFIECACSSTPKCASFELAWAHWHKQHRLQPSAAALAERTTGGVRQIGLFGLQQVPT
ncbi:hypothetical protein D7Y39_05000 [Stenotrophomonas maltophilia]|uniref:hypothetical protein n=1 Tax=Stenotrophomonas maltophilia TaxID=40324 RepID=UPI0015DE8E4F|nr:hypothetical protein [Stenotrophomonas maltophilia]MBA0289190.1 hypothetical protein [Stenotrophomonas maltophilia]